MGHKFDPAIDTVPALRQSEASLAELIDEVDYLRLAVEAHPDLNRKAEEIKGRLHAVKFIIATVRKGHENG